MAICINVKNPDFLSLKSTFSGSISDADLKAAIGLWQANNGIDNWPSLAQVRGVLEAAGVTYSIPIQRDIAQSKATNSLIKPGVEKLFDSNPELASIGTQEQYSQYLDTIFPESKLKDIVYHGTEKDFDSFKVEYDRNGNKITSVIDKENKNNFGIYFGSWVSHYYGNDIGYKFRKSVVLDIKNPRIVNHITLSDGINIDNNESIGLGSADALNIRQFYNITNEDGIIQVGPFHGNNEVSYEDFEDTYTANTSNILEIVYDRAKEIGAENYLDELAENKELQKEAHNKLKEAISSGELLLGNMLQEAVVFNPEQIHILGSKQDIEGFKEFVNTETAQQSKNAQIQDDSFQKLSSEGRKVIESTLRDLGARLSTRIGIPVRFINDVHLIFKGMTKRNEAVINLAYATLDTPIHEIMGHPIIRAIKGAQIVDENAFDVLETKDVIGYENQDGYVVINYKNVIAFDTFYKTKEEAKAAIPSIKERLSQNSKLYYNLVKELETGRGKEVLDRIKKDYNTKNDFVIGFNNIVKKDGYFVLQNNKTETLKLKDNVSSVDRIFLSEQEANKYLNENRYTLEEQQEEAIVELLGLMTADHLDIIQDGKLISLLKDLYNKIKSFLRDLLRQREVQIAELPDNMTLEDIAILLAYSNSKIILPGYEAKYITPDNKHFKTYKEASNYISYLIKNLGNSKSKNLTEKYIVSTDMEEEWRDFYGVPSIAFFNSLTEAEDFLNTFSSFIRDELKLEKATGVSQAFIAQNKEYEHSKQIIEEWKKVNNIIYNPDEVYSRGQGFYHAIGAYQYLELELLLQNLINNVETVEQANGQYTVSAFTKPINTKLKHLEKSGINLVIYPKSEHILHASPSDVYSGSMRNKEGIYALDFFPRQGKKELYPVVFSKYPVLQNVTKVSPNLASIITERNHHHNELGIALTTTNFRIEYNEDVPFKIKQLIDKVNAILDQKYGEVVIPNISTNSKVEPIITKDNLVESIKETIDKLSSDAYMKKEVDDIQLDGIIQSVKKKGYLSVQDKQYLEREYDVEDVYINSYQENLDVLKELNKNNVKLIINDRFNPSAIQKIYWVDYIDHNYKSQPFTSLDLLSIFKKSLVQHDDMVRKERKTLKEIENNPSLLKEESTIFSQRLLPQNAERIMNELKDDKNYSYHLEKQFYGEDFAFPGSTYLTYGALKAMDYFNKYDKVRKEFTEVLKRLEEEVAEYTEQQDLLANSSLEVIPSLDESPNGQAQINAKIIELKETFQKYPRALIRSEVSQLKNTQDSYSQEFKEDEELLQKVPSNTQQNKNAQIQDNILLQKEVKPIITIKPKDIAKFNALKDKISLLKSGTIQVFNQEDATLLYNLLTPSLKAELAGFNFQEYLNTYKKTNLFERILNFILSTLGLIHNNHILNELIKDYKENVLTPEGELLIYGIERNQKTRLSVLNRLIYKGIIPGNYNKKEIFKEVLHNLLNNRDYEYFIKTLNRWASENISEEENIKLPNWALNITEEQYKKREDAWRLSNGLPQINNTFKFLGINENGESVYDFNNPNFNLENEEEILKGIDKTNAVMGKYRVKTGIDSLGHFIQYSDRWDIDLKGFIQSIVNITQTPFVITGKIYKAFSYNSEGDLEYYLTYDGTDVGITLYKDFINGLEERDNVLFEPEMIKDQVDNIIDEVQTKAAAEPTIQPSEPFTLRDYSSVDKALNNKIGEWLKQLGISVSMTDKIYDRNGNEISAVAKADLVRKVIEIVEGKADITTLGEEASHFLVEMLQDTLLGKQLIYHAGRSETYQQVLTDYADVYGDPVENNLLYLKEAAGKLIAQEIVKLWKAGEQNHVQESSTFTEFLSKIFNDLIQWLQKLFKGTSTGLQNYDNEIAPFREAALKILRGDVTNLTVGNYIGEMYELSTDEKLAHQKNKIILEAAQIEKRPGENFYRKTSTGEKVIRVSEIIRKYYMKHFKDDTKFGPFLANKGTVMHKWYEVIGRAIYNKTSLDYYAMYESVVKSFEDDPDINFENLREFVYLTPGQFRDIVKGLHLVFNSIHRNQDLINKQNGTNGEATIYFELMVGGDKSDYAGTLDVAVLYSNGKVAIYDYKNVIFHEHQGAIFNEIPAYKLQEYEMKVTQYKNILYDQGIKEFAETRIIPINVQYSKAAQETKRGFTKIEMFDPASPNQEYLGQIAVAKELTGLAEFDKKVLDKLYLRLKNLQQNLEKRYTPALEANVKFTRQIIQNILVKKDYSLILEELLNINTTFNNDKLRVSGDPSAIGVDFITDALTVIKVYEQFAPALIQDLVKQNALSEKEMQIIKEVSYQANVLKAQLNEAKMDILRAAPDESNIDITKPGKIDKGFSNFFKSVSEFAHPIFQRLSSLLRYSENATLQEMKKIETEITTNSNVLESWAKQNGMTLKEAFRKLYNPETGNLIARYDKKLFADIQEARDKEDISFFLKYYQIALVREGAGMRYVYTGKALETFNSVKERRKVTYAHKFPNDPELQEKELQKWLSKVDISTNPKNIFKPDAFMFIDYTKTSEYLSKEFKYVQNHKPLLDYYDMYVRYNELFEDITGKKINDNFVANIREDLLDRIGTLGLGAIAGSFSNILHSLEVRDSNTFYTEKDLKEEFDVDGKAILRVPLFFMDDLQTLLNDEEKAKVKARISTQHKEGTPEYAAALQNALVAEQKVKGLKDKSYDLSRSLLLMARNVYHYKHMTEIEGYIKILQHEVRNNENLFSSLDETDKTILDRFKGMLKTKLGIDDSMASAFESFVNLHIYGKKNQDLSKTWTIGREVDAEGNIINPGKTFSSSEALNKFMQWSSMATLGLKPVLGARNYIQVKSNMFIVATEGLYFTGKDVRNANAEARQNSKKYFAAVEFFRTYSNDMVYEKANKLSANGLTKLLTTDNLFIMLKSTDENVDRGILVSMMMSHGITADGRVKPLKYIKSGDTRSIYERMSLQDNGDVVIDGMNLKQFGTFRAQVQRVATMVKGIVPQNDRLLINTMTIGQLLMQYRSWLPGLAKARFAGTRYDPLLDTVEVGRFIVGFQDILQFGEGSAKSFSKLALASLPILGLAFDKNLEANTIKAKELYEEFKRENPDVDISFEEFVEIRTGKLRGLAMEIQTVLSLLLLMMLARAMIPEDKDANPVGKLAAQTFYRVLNGAYLEASFFVSLNSFQEIFRSPMAIVGFGDNLAKLFSNTLDETRDLVMGKDMKGFLPWNWVEDKNDKTPVWYYGTKVIPGVNGFVDFLNLYDNFTYKKR
jgi:hypothetical protein